MYLCQANLTAISTQDGKDPGTSLRCKISTDKAAEMDQCPIETLYLLKFLQTINQSELNKSMTKYIFEELRKDHNKKEKDQKN